MRVADAEEMTAKRWRIQMQGVCVMGNVETLGRLLAEMPAGCGVDDEIMEVERATTVMLASWNGFPGLCEMLLQAGADPLRRNAHGLSAQNFGHTPQRRSKLRNERGAQIVAAFADGRSVPEGWRLKMEVGRKVQPVDLDLLKQRIDFDFDQNFGFRFQWNSGASSGIGEVWLRPEEVGPAREALDRLTRGSLALGYVLEPGRRGRAK